MKPGSSADGLVAQDDRLMLGRDTVPRQKGTDASLHAQLAAAIAAGDKNQVFVLAARVVAAGPIGNPKPMSNDDHLLPVEEVARRLDTSVRSITRYLARPNGNFPRPTYVGRRRKWEPTDIETYKTAQRLKHAK